MRALGQALAAATGAALLVAMSFPRVAYHAHILASGALEDQMRTETETALSGAIGDLSAPRGVEARAICGSSAAAALHRLGAREVAMRLARLREQDERGRVGRLGREGEVEQDEPIGDTA